MQRERTANWLRVQVELPVGWNLDQHSDNFGVNSRLALYAASQINFHERRARSWIREPDQIHGRCDLLLALPRVRDESRLYNLPGLQHDRLHPNGHFSLKIARIESEQRAFSPGLARRRQTNGPLLQHLRRLRPRENQALWHL